MAPEPQIIPEVIPCISASIELLALVRLSDRVVLARRAAAGASEDDLELIQAAMDQLLQRTPSHPVVPGWKGHVPLDVEDSAAGEVYALADPTHGICLAVAATKNVRDAAAQRFLEDFLEKVRSSRTAAQLSEGKAETLSGPLHELLDKVMRAHAAAVQSNKTLRLHQEVDEIKSVMQENVRRIVETHVALETLEGKSHSMSETADQFLKTTHSAKEHVHWRNVRVKAVMITGFGAAAMTLLMPLWS